MNKILDFKYFADPACLLPGRSDGQVYLLKAGRLELEHYELNKHFTDGL
ncbi:MAG: hypothetical protein KJ578_04515 [Bacteroidetes bacterium]|nr:hypothetical protein [Bacteroidota bacterium]MBU1579405.1 hypothetical protein [Bacteroidota bacterium]MBU2557027.1 hypothetical protein [Bacteroidota bacterium]